MSDALPIRLLVVDDHESIRSMMSMLISEKVYDYQDAADGRDAMKILQTFDADVVVTDIGMPVLDGIALVRRIRIKDAENRKKTYIIAMSAYDEEDKPELGDRSLFDYVLKKPLAFPELLALLEEYCQK